MEMLATLSAPSFPGRPWSQVCNFTRARHVQETVVSVEAHQVSPLCIPSHPRECSPPARGHRMQRSSEPNPHGPRHVKRLCLTTV